MINLNTASTIQILYEYKRPRNIECIKLNNDDSRSEGALTVTGCLKIEAVCRIGGTKLASALNPRARSNELLSLLDP